MLFILYFYDNIFIVSLSLFLSQSIKAIALIFRIHFTKRCIIKVKKRNNYFRFRKLVVDCCNLTLLRSTKNFNLAYQVRKIDLYLIYLLTKFLVNVYQSFIASLIIASVATIATFVRNYVNFENIKKAYFRWLIMKLNNSYFICRKTIIKIINIVRYHFYKVLQNFQVIRINVKTIS